VAASGGCCGCCNRGSDIKKLREERSKHQFVKGGDNDISEGPAGKRHCTDCPCCVIMIVALVAYVVVTLLGLQDGNLDRLYKPRDSAGNYCGVNENWNSGPTTITGGNLENYDYQTYTMNVSKTTDEIMKQMVCSKASQDYLITSLSRTEFDEYMCSCCNVPCAKCTQANDVGGDPSANLADPNAAAAAIRDVTSARISDLTGLSSSSIAGLYNPAGANGDLFGENLFTHATAYLHKVCLGKCQLSYTELAGNTSYAFRSYTYSPTPDDELSTAWKALMGDDTLGAVINSSFTYRAYSEADCPYDARLCVPFPGIEFEEAALNYCTLKVAAEVVQSLGETLSGILESEALTDFSNSATESLGEQWGSFQNSIPAFILTCVSAFVIGMLFLVLIRFFAGICVWLSILVITLIICSFAFLCYIKSIQCAGASLLDTGKQTTTQVVTYASTTASQTLSGETVSEELTGDGNGYRGVQSVSRFGQKCQKWSDSSPHQYLTYNVAPYTTDQGIGDHAFCRNPYLANDTNKGTTIWCFTQDPDLRWAECLPIGLNPPECAQGYAVTGQTARDVLLYTCYVILGIAGLWVLIVMCFCKQIMLAIRVTQVASRFLASTPTVLIVPLVQVVSTVVWCLAWFYGAAFILSQVPEDYSPSGYYATYNEAWEACTFEGSGPYGYPVSEVWRDETCGGDAIAKCWRCQPPRYMLGVEFAYTFFVYLWVNAFFIAAGQCIIAGAVGYWFFHQNTDRSQRRGALKTSIWNVVRYHLGSLAFGSFIIAVVQFIRYLMLFLEKQAAARKNRVMVYVLKCVQCLIWCFEKSLEYINKLAYIQIALLGTNFCTSAKKAFYLVLRHAARFASVMVLGSAIDFIGFLCILSGTTVVGYLIQVHLHAEVSPLLPVLIYALVGYVVGKLYMNVFHLAIDASLQCYIAAEEMGIPDDTVPRELKRLIKVKAADKKDAKDEPPETKENK
jgi:hypothetical protein